MIGFLDTFFLPVLRFAAFGSEKENVDKKRINPVSGIFDYPVDDDIRVLLQEAGGPGSGP
jgi:hypothetical protein